MLAHNPLGLASFRAIATLKNLRLLDLSSTERTEVMDWQWCVGLCKVILDIVVL